MTRAEPAVDRRARHARRRLAPVALALLAACASASSAAPSTTAAPAAGPTSPTTTRPARPASSVTLPPTDATVATTAVVATGTTVLAKPTSSMVAQTAAATTVVVATTVAPGAPAPGSIVAPSPPRPTTEASSVASTSLAARRALDVTLDAMPEGLIRATGPATLDAATNPINGRRGGTHPVAGAPWCTVDPAALEACLPATLDTLGFDVTGGAPEDQARHRRQAIAALQLDADLSPTGVADEALLRYAGVWPGSAQGGTAAEVRVLGASAQGRPITAYRYGSGARTVLVVAQTHGDEEAGLRVWLRARSLPVPAGVTLWVVPTMNPDGLVHDTRFLADGADPNRRSPAEPEQVLIDEFARSVRPDLSVWYHQNYGWIGGSGASMAPAAAYHERVLLGPLYRSGDCVHGFTWCAIDEAVGGSSILVELPDIVTPADVRRHADALLAVAGAAP